MTYYKLSDKSFLYYYYAYLDSVDYLADQLFINNKVEVKYLEEYKHPDYDYVVIICKIRKKDEAAFIRAIERLPQKMYFLGYKEYEQALKKWEYILTVPPKEWEFD